MEIGVLYKNGMKAKISLTDEVHQIFLTDETRVLPLMSPESIQKLNEILKEFMRGEK